ncbi:MAG TPA: hypothetical protein VF828_01685 [Patescibacteria group bacterium]
MSLTYHLLVENLSIKNKNILMPEFVVIFFFLLTTALAYLISVTPAAFFAPQILAVLALFLVIFLTRRPLLTPLLSFLSCLLLFLTGGLSSPLFFLSYFLLFIIAFLSSSVVTLSCTLILIFFLSQSLNSVASLIPLFSLIFIAPLVWFINRLKIDNTSLHHEIASDETDIFLWLSLRFRSTLGEITSLSSGLLDSKRLAASEKADLRTIRHLSRRLLKSSQKLISSLENNDQK